MGENHLTYFKIENFKRFDSFEMENLGQFNLLVGDNNVGKTSVLEGLLFSEDGDSSLVGLFQTLIYRRLIIQDENKVLANLNDDNLWQLIFKKIEKPLITKILTKKDEVVISWSIIDIDKLSESDWKAIGKKGFRKNEISVFKKGLRISSRNNSNYNFYPFAKTTNEEIEINLGYLPFVPTNLGYNNDLLEFYYQNINNDKLLRREFETNLKMFIPNLEETRTQKMLNDIEFVCVVLEDENGIYPLTRFGDGVVKFARVLLEILMAKGKRLMIDEIETGIHFSRLKDFWKTVITLCKKYEVQLFATTHSLECQRYFLEAFTELGEEYQKEARNISLLENKEGNIESVTYDFEQFGFAMEIGFNTRGGF
jgi:AAA15 family ATPase/GTPase